MERIARIYLKDPLPQLFSDEIYIESLLKHTLLPYDARTLSWAALNRGFQRHFGNTDCANEPGDTVSTGSEGQEHDLWNYGPEIALSIC